MNDRQLAEEMLLTIKGVCDLYLHGVIESSSPEIVTAFKDALCHSITIQKDIYEKMSQKGWYTTETEEAQKIQKVKDSYSS